MTTLTIQRDTTTWLLFSVAALLSGLFAGINLYEFVIIGIFKQTSGYPFGGEGPSPWFYQTAKMYATVNLIVGILFTITLASSFWTFIRLKKAALFTSLILTLLLIFSQIVNGQLN